MILYLLMRKLLVGGLFWVCGVLGGTLLKGKEKQTKKCVSESKNKNN